MDKRAMNFLNELRDGRWHRKNLFTSDVGIIQARVHLGLVEKKIRHCVHFELAGGKIKYLGKREIMPGTAPYHWMTRFRITAKGKKSLKTGKGPTPVEIFKACHYNLH